LIEKHEVTNTALVIIRSKTSNEMTREEKDVTTYQLTCTFSDSIQRLSAISLL